MIVLCVAPPTNNVPSPINSLRDNRELRGQLGPGPTSKLNNMDTGQTNKQPAGDTSSQSDPPQRGMIQSNQTSTLLYYGFTGLLQKQEHGEMLSIMTWCTLSTRPTVPPAGVWDVVPRAKAVRQLVYWQGLTSTTPNHGAPHQHPDYHDCISQLKRWHCPVNQIPLAPLSKPPELTLWC